jgi:DNA-binding CsgD family transcriptional regulator
MKDPQLTARELEVIEQIMKHQREKQAAQNLGIEVRTVSTHVRNIYRKLGVNSRSGLLDWAAMRGRA